MSEAVYVLIAVAWLGAVVGTWLTLNWIERQWGTPTALVVCGLFLAFSVGFLLMGWVS